MTNITTLFTALADPTRRAIFEKLARRDLPVGQLARGLAVTRPAVSQHLKVLYEAELVIVRTEGTKRIYSINTKGVEAMRAYLDKLWDKALANFKQHIERNDT